MLLPTVKTVCIVWKKDVYPNFLKSDEHAFGVRQSFPSDICCDTALCCKKSKLNPESISKLSLYLIPSVNVIKARIATTVLKIRLDWWISD
jgi:hypothetical protein